MARRCRECKSLFKPTYNTIQPTCSIKCAIAWGKTEPSKVYAKKVSKAETRTMKKVFKEKDKSWWIKKAQVVFNKWIRSRDKDKPCISCGTRLDVQYCAGHYKSRGAYPELRFEPLNVHKQCNKNCNLEKSGNIAKYRKGLYLRVGRDSLDWIEGPHDPKKYTIDDLKEIIERYKL